MFQFRPFPSYAYLIQRRITKYCFVGFPHSEIHGYNGYLLLPVAYRSLSRPSSAPDAKAFPLRSFQLDRRRVKLRSLRFRRQPSAFAKSSVSLRCPSSFLAQTLRWFARGGDGGYGASRFLSRRVIRDFGSLKNYAGNFTEVLCSKLLPSSLRCSTMKTNYLLLPCLSLSLCSVFKVQRSGFETRLKYSIS